MDIKDFIKKTLEDISTGVAESNKSQDNDTFRVSNEISFDLAVTASTEDSVKGEVSAKAGIKVLGVNGDIESQNRGSQQTASHIHFKVFRSSSKRNSSTVIL